MRTSVQMPFSWRMPHSERSRVLDEDACLAVLRVERQQVAVGVVVGRIEEAPIFGIVGKRRDLVHRRAFDVDQVTHGSRLHVDRADVGDGTRIVERGVERPALGVDECPGD
jgi:hypothetical protein